MKSSKLIASVSFCLLVVAAFIPYTSTIVPEWKVIVLDSKKHPCENQRVTEDWNYESLEITNDLPHGGAEQKLTNKDGQVQFPERTIRASLAWRVVGNILGFLGIFIHNPGGPPHGYIYVTGMLNAEHGFGISYRAGRNMPYEIIVDECFDSSKEFRSTN